MAFVAVPAGVEAHEVVGLFSVHSCPRALVPHVEWALAREIGRVVKLDWQPQPLLTGMMRAEVEWSGPCETAAAVASSLLGWQQLRFEVTEQPTAHSPGGRWAHTPSLGIRYTQIDAAGNAVLTENQVRSAIEAAGDDHAALPAILADQLGSAWDRELEPFRAAEEGDATIFTLHRVG